MKRIIASARITVVTESGARYFIRTHGPRAYVTRADNGTPMTGNAPVNRVVTEPITLFKGEPMVVHFMDGGILRTTPVRVIATAVVSY